jgi:hypothetical protein
VHDHDLCDHVHDYGGHYYDSGDTSLIMVNAIVITMAVFGEHDHHRGEHVHDSGDNAHDYGGHAPKHAVA